MRSRGSVLGIRGSEGSKSEIALLHTVTTGHVLLLCVGNVGSTTEELNFEFDLIYM